MQRLRYSIWVIAGLLWVEAPFAISSEDLELNEVVERLQTTYEGISGFQARFHQRTYRLDGGVALEASGTIAYQKPSQMRWDYEPPDAQQVIIDGTKLWIYYPEERQVIWRTLVGALPSTPLFLLAGVAELNQEFEIQWSSPKMDGKAYSLDLKPAKDIPGRYQIAVDREKFLISKIISLDPIGYKTEWRFVEIRTGTLFPPGFFKFTPPKGVEVIEAP